MPTIWLAVKKAGQVKEVNRKNAGRMMVIKNRTEINPAGGILPVVRTIVSKKRIL